MTVNLHKNIWIKQIGEKGEPNDNRRKRKFSEKKTKGEKRSKGAGRPHSVKP